MVYLLDIHNYGNKGRPSTEPLASYPPYFVIEIDNATNTARAVMGRFFLADSGVTTDELIAHLMGHMEESDVLPEYQVHYFNGVRENRAHRVSIISANIDLIDEGKEGYHKTAISEGDRGGCAVFL